MSSSRFDLRGKVAIVTGGNGGIGLGMARGLADAGADIAVVGRNDAKSKAAVEDLRQRGVKAIVAQRCGHGRQSPRGGGRCRAKEEGASVKVHGRASCVC